MIIIYVLLFILTSTNIFKGYKSSKELIENVYNDSEFFNTKTLKKISAGIWILVILLIILAKIKYNMPSYAAYLLIMLKIPSVLYLDKMTEDGKYTKGVFAADKLDQLTNIILCFFVFISFLK